jgi:hypothetical protein
MWSNNVSVWCTSSHSVPAPHSDGVCLTFSILLKNFFNYFVQFFHFVIFILQCWMYTCTIKIITSSSFNTSAIILLLHTVLLLSLCFMHRYWYASFDPFTSGIIIRIIATSFFFYLVLSTTLHCLL